MLPRLSGSSSTPASILSDERVPRMSFYRVKLKRGLHLRLRKSSSRRDRDSLYLAPLSTVGSCAPSEHAREEEEYALGYLVLSPSLSLTHTLSTLRLLYPYPQYPYRTLFSLS